MDYPLELFELVLQQFNRQWERIAFAIAGLDCSDDDEDDPGDSE